MLIETGNLSLEQKKQIENFLYRMGIHFTSQKEIEIMRYQEKLKEEYETTVFKTNLFNIKMINLLVKAAIPEQWIGKNNLLSFYYYSTIKNPDNDNTSCFFDNQNYELMNDVQNPEEVEHLLCYIADNLELNFDFTFSDNNDDFCFDSEQEKLTQLF